MTSFDEQTGESISDQDGHCSGLTVAVGILAVGCNPEGNGFVELLEVSKRLFGRFALVSFINHEGPGNFFKGVQPVYVTAHGEIRHDATVEMGLQM